MCFYFNSADIGKKEVRKKYCAGVNFDQPRLIDKKNELGSMQITTGKRTLNFDGVFEICVLARNVRWSSKKTVKIRILMQKSQKMSGVEAFEKLKQKMKGDNEKEIQKSESDRKKRLESYIAQKAQK